jgi:hypothetical protein
MISVEAVWNFAERFETFLPEFLKGTIMNHRSSRGIFFAVLLTLGLLLTASAGFAQQVTYYDFDAPPPVPQTVPPTAPAPVPSSLHCDPTPGATSNPLFCFNNGAGSDPGFMSTIYPAIIDPVTTDNPPVSSTHFGSQLTAPLTGQASSMWFSVPQKVSNGFTSYFAFRITPDNPNHNSFATADGITFAIQNAAGNGSSQNAESTCTEIGSGPTAVGGGGGCIGYGGLDNSLVFELDTYKNSWDPTDSFASPYIGSASNDNHIAIQNCGRGLANSPEHTGNCLVQLGQSNQTSTAAIQSALSNFVNENVVPITLADGNVHQVVIQYSGPTEASPNFLQIFVDPGFVSGTHTPVAGSVPVLSGTYDIAANLNLMNSGSALDSAYVGFTSATGGAFELHELLAWTYTPHTPVTETQPIAQAGAPTAFPFGAHTYAVTYPANIDTTQIDMVVTANTITPDLFRHLIFGSTFDGSVCQIYDETGGNCVVYSTSCVIHNTSTVVACPASEDSSFISLKSAYNNTIQPTAPGFLKGDPFYSLLTSITINNGVAKVICVGECSVSTGQTVTISGNSLSPFAVDKDVVVLPIDPATPNIFSFNTPASGTGTGGYITSKNLQNAFTSYVSQRIDGTTTGKTKNFSDFVVTSVTSATTSMVITAPSIAYGNSASVTVAVSSGAGTPSGNVSLTVDGGAAQTQPLSNGSAPFSVPGLTGGNHSLVATYAAQDIFQAATQTATLSVTKAPSTTAASATPNPSAVGAVVTVTANVTGAGSPTGTFSASTGAGNPTCTGTLTSGTGSCTLTFLTPGARTISVAYSGDNNFATSTSAFTQNVSGPVAAVSPGSIDFGTVYLATLSVKSVTLSNVGTSPMTIKEKFLAIVGGGNSNEFVSLSLCPSTLNPGKSCTILVSFIAGPTYTPQTATLMINDSAANSPQTVALTANVINPQASFSPSSVNFGTLTVGTASQAPIVVTNSGNTPLTITNLGISGTNASDFTVIGNTCLTVAAKANCTITVRFVPGKSGARTATLTVKDNVWNGAQQVSLSGKGK